jgi:hypothetical protein
MAADDHFHSDVVQLLNLQVPRPVGQSIAIRDHLILGVIKPSHQGGALRNKRFTIASEEAT